MLNWPVLYYLANFAIPGTTDEKWSFVTMMSANYGFVLPLSCSSHRVQSIDICTRDNDDSDDNGAEVTQSLSAIITWCDEKSRHYTIYSPWELFPIIVVLPYSEVICQLLVAPCTGWQRTVGYGSTCPTWFHTIEIKNKSLKHDYAFMNIQR